MAFALMQHQWFLNFALLVLMCQLNISLSLQSFNQSHYPPVLQTKPFYFSTDFPLPTEKYVNDDEGKEQASSNCECGLSDREKIVSGTEASEHQFPWMAYLVIGKGGRSALCGGFLVTDRHVLTAAHCTSGVSDTAVKLTLGSNDPKNDKNAVKRTSQKVTIHPNYDSRQNVNDVSVITMDSSVTFSERILPICLPEGNDEYVGETGIVAGWGTLFEGGSTTDELMTGTVPILANDDKDCVKAYGSSIKPQMICAGGKNTDTCQGDSGGPLMVADGLKYTAIGTVSFGIGCGRRETPGIYGRLTALMLYVNQEISSGKKCN